MLCSKAHGTGLSDGLCATYTVSDILQRLDGRYQNRPGHEIDTALSNNFERIVVDSVFERFMDRMSGYIYNPYLHDDLDGQYYRRTVRYHPDELSQIYPLVNTFLRARGSLIPLPVLDAGRSTETRTATSAITSTSTANNIPNTNCVKTYVFLGASFSARSWNIKRDVTPKIKELVKSHFGCLVLHPSLAPEGVEWYYCSLFGDIAPQIRKTLSIRVWDPETGRKLTVILGEEESFVLRLDFPDLDTAN